MMLQRGLRFGLPQRVRHLGAGLALPVAAAVALATGALPLADAGAVLQRITPVLAFLVAVTVVAELADAAGLFERAAEVAARAARGRVIALWLLVVALATGTTVVLSLDTTAVLLTPVVLALTQRLRLAPLPFALVTVWLANTGSLLLPVSNLTNLLAVERTGWGAAGWAARLALPALVAVVTTALVCWLLFRRSLRGAYTVPELSRPPHRVRLTVAALTCVGLGIAVTLGTPPWLAAGVAALVLVAAFAAGDAGRLGPHLVPVRLVVGTVSIFLLVAVAERHGLSTLLHRAAGTPDGTTGAVDVLRTAAVGAGTANAVNNLPAYLAVEPAVAADPLRLLALLVGTNAGPLVTPWASLATLLWLDRCRARDVRVSWVRFVGYGLVVVVPVVTATALALLVSR